jgi:fused signal recognition particle receptor
MVSSRRLVQNLATAICCASAVVDAFLSSPPPPAFGVSNPSSSRHHSQSSVPKHRRRHTHLSMVFDFFRDRSQEGLDQLQQFGAAAQKGQLGQGLADLASYTTQTNQAFADGLARSRNRLLENLESLVTGVSPAELLEELTDLLLQADLGLATAEDIVAEVKSLRADATQRLSQEDLRSILRGKIIEALETGQSSRIRFREADCTTIPTVLFVMGANGMGKTTTIGKLAYRLRTEGNQTVLLAACDTFRAGAVAQLEQWADRAGVALVGPSTTATSPAAVLYAALDQAVADGVDTVLVDTSGRLSNNDQLTAELAKMKRVIQKRLSVAQDENGQALPNTNVPHETLLVLDAAQGRMALDSARVWNDEIGLTGLILTKLDGSARGGSVVAVSRDLQLPVKLIGVGEGMEDLRDVRVPFRPFFRGWLVMPSWPSSLCILCPVSSVGVHASTFCSLFSCDSGTYSLKPNDSWMVCWGLARQAVVRRKMKGKCWPNGSMRCARNAMYGPRNASPPPNRLRSPQPLPPCRRRTNKSTMTVVSSN